jgi:hypothetical protein
VSKWLILWYGVVFFFGLLKKMWMKIHEIFIKGKIVNLIMGAKKNNNTTIIFKLFLLVGAWAPDGCKDATASALGSN